MSLEAFQAELTLKIEEIDSLCAKYGFAATPTIVLRHDKGPASSVLLGNDSADELIKCISVLSEIGEKTDQSPHEALMRLLAE